jgi:hypothetical protein
VQETRLVPLVWQSPHGRNCGAHRIRTGPRSGQRTSMADANEGLVTDQGPPPAVLRCANYQGFSVHANVAVRASDRKRLESLCKYAARPPLAHERLQETSGGRLVYRMKTPWRSGQTHVVMERIELIEKLAALVPRPRYHIVITVSLPPPRNGEGISFQIPLRLNSVHMIRTLKILSPQKTTLGHN